MTPRRGDADRHVRMDGARLALAALLVLCLLGGARDGFAQQAELDRVETLIANGEYAQARDGITRWWERVDGGEVVPGPARARALLLRARLEPDPSVAELDYLTLALTHPTAPEAPEALLRLGQALLATGDAARAGTYLERLVNDHPGSAQRPIGMLWLARARHADGRAADACRLMRDGARVAEPVPDLRSLIRAEEATHCAAVAEAAVAEAANAARAPEPVRASEPAHASGRFAVQSGAFRQRAGALELAQRLRQAGHEPRLVGLPGSSLLRVRVGRFADRDAAQTLAGRLRAAGFEAVVVADATRERPEH